MPTIYSTLTEDQSYTKWNTNGDMNTIQRSVLIKGGHGKFNSKNLITPIGVGTEVTDEEVEFLKTIPSFMDHLNNGYLTISGKKADPETVAESMNQNDPSAQKTEVDFDEEEAPVVNKSKKRKGK